MAMIRIIRGCYFRQIQQFCRPITAQPPIRLETKQAEYALKGGRFGLSVFLFLK